MHSSGSIQLHDKSYDRRLNNDNENEKLGKFFWLLLKKIIYYYIKISIYYKLKKKIRLI